MIFAEHDTNAAKKKKGRKGFQHHFNLPLLRYGIATHVHPIFFLELFAIFELVTALVVKAMRNKKRRRKILWALALSQHILERAFVFESSIERTYFL